MCICVVGLAGARLPGSMAIAIKPDIGSALDPPTEIVSSRQMHCKPANQYRLATMMVQQIADRLLSVTAASFHATTDPTRKTSLTLPFWWPRSMMSLLLRIVLVFFRRSSYHAG